jgi:hypothetical protein
MKVVGKKLARIQWIESEGSDENERSDENE